ncbi:MAG TPA: protoglobin domain-containing protein [Patescibacteria group bacterium]|nr:protoglobin domain-containing protein [Patescibacteria group bacterium]
MKRYVGFDAADAGHLATLRPYARPHFRQIAETFYETIQRHPGASRVFSGQDQVERLKVSLQQWAELLLTGPYDEAYYGVRCRIGRVHVKVGLQQMYMLTAMNVIRGSFREIVFRELAHDPALKDAIMIALHKILDLELAIMLETYREDYIAKLYRSEQQAALSRLAAIGEVAASVAHEIRNPLAGISGAVEVLRDDLPASSPRREVIKEVLGQIRRLDERVRDLLIYARTIRLDIEPVDPAELIRATQSLLSEEPLVRGVRVQVSVPQGVGRHPMDRGRIVEVLVNLIRNAAEAMNGEGDLLLAAGRLQGGALALIVEDSGPGVPAERVEEIFAPFVTTRPQGTGLGLAISRRTLEAHGGSLTCEKGSLGGARFIAVIPQMVPTT